jgi:hypothetical protein
MSAAERRRRNKVAREVMTPIGVSVRGVTLLAQRSPPL